jgi:hypothetical protein
MTLSRSFNSEIEHHCLLIPSDSKKCVLRMPSMLLLNADSLPTRKLLQRIRKLPGQGGIHGNPILKSRGTTHSSDFILDNGAISWRKHNNCGDPGWPLIVVSLEKMIRRIWRWPRSALQMLYVLTRRTETRLRMVTTLSAIWVLDVSYIFYRNLGDSSTRHEQICLSLYQHYLYAFLD